MTEKAKPKAKRKTGTTGNVNARVHRLRIARQEELREKLKGLEYLRQIEQDYDKLDALFKKIEKLKAKRLSDKRAAATGQLHDYGVLNVELSKCIAQRDVLKVKLDVNFRRLRLVLPELKSVELTDPDGGSPFAALSAMITRATKDNSR